MKKIILSLMVAVSFIYAESEVLINSKVVKSPKVKVGDTIETKKEAFKFNINKDAFLVRPNSKVVFDGNSGTVKTLKVITGGILAVFGKGAKTIETKTMTAGIRGTGVYLEATENSTYFCDCYGIVDLRANDEKYKHLHTTLDTKHHGAKEFFIKDGKFFMEDAGMINHTDKELIELEAMVGRKVPFK